MSTQALLIGLSLVVVLSVVARIFGGMVNIPVIVPLLAIGIIAGISVADVVEPNKLLGSALSPFVQIVVALILFEGALGLRFDQFPKEVRPAVLRLITLGVLVTWIMGAIGAIFILDLPTEIGVLVGAILIVSGPTVVLPLLDFVRPPFEVRATLKWEGVIMDPIGAIVAVVVFASLTAKDGFSAFSIEQFVLSVVVGVISGVVFAALLMPILGTHRLNGRDKVAATLMMVVAAFMAADVLFEDSGLAAALVMGIALANQRRVNMTYITEFKETLIPILLGILFVLLAANVEMGDVFDIGLPGIAFIAFLAFIVRPLAVLTTIGLPISWKQRLYMMTFSARGIVAAATAPVFGLALTTKNVAGAEKIVPVVFMVIIGTVLISSILSPLAGKALGMAGKTDPSMVIVGGPRWAIALAQALEKAGTDVRFWVVEKQPAEDVKAAGLELTTEPIDPRDPDRIIGLNGVSLIAIASPDDAANQLLAWNLSDVLEPDQIYRIPGPPSALEVVENAGRLITTDVGIDEIEKRVEAGQEFAVFDSDAALPEGAVPLVVLETKKGLARPELYFYCDREQSPRHRIRRVAALVPASPAPAG
ncbi:MAG: cation:proton antiporter [Solirubrobacterales bacterium]